MQPKGQKLFFCKSADCFSEWGLGSRVWGSINKSLKMEAFWWQQKEKMNKKSEFGLGPLACVEWVGGKEHNKYGRTQVVWPDGRTTVERAHRLAFMIEHKILRDDMPIVNAQGKKLEVSHLCHNGLCVKAAHLALESHEINMERVLCKSRRQCSTLHEPFCLFWRQVQPFHA